MSEYTGAQYATQSSPINQSYHVTEKTTNQAKEPNKNNLQRTISHPRAARPQDILGLQAVVGNQAVNAIIQAKLSVGPVSDHFEREADRIAEQIVSRGQSDRRDPLLISALDGRQQGRKQPVVSPGKDENGSSSVPTEIESHLQAHRGQGQVLPEATRKLMESQFAVDLSEVRVHTGQAAANISQRLNAEAFTHGRDIYMNAGRYEPQTESGQRLLAHEITHVVQQGGTKAAQAAPPSIQRVRIPWGSAETFNRYLPTPVRRHRLEQERHEWNPRINPAPASMQPQPAAMLGNHRRPRPQMGGHRSSRANASGSGAPVYDPQQGAPLYPSWLAPDAPSYPSVMGTEPGVDLPVYQYLKRQRRRSV